MKFEYFIATKHLLRGRRHGFVSLIAFISVLGIAVGVMALIVVLAVMSGFDRELKTKIVGVQPHIVLEALQGIQDLDGVRSTIESLGIREITSIAPFVQGQGIVRSERPLQGSQRSAHPGACLCGLRHSQPSQLQEGLRPDHQRTGRRSR